MKKRTSGPSGQHKSPRRLLSQSEVAWGWQDKAASYEGQTWAEWARETLAKRETEYRVRVGTVLKAIVDLNRRKVDSDPSPNGSGPVL